MQLNKLFLMSLLSSGLLLSGCSCSSVDNATALPTSSNSEVTTTNSGQTTSQNDDTSSTEVYNGETPVINEETKTITYGLYPQKNVNDEALIAALDKLTTAEANGWYLYRGEYYAKVSAKYYLDGVNRTFDNGTTIVKGTTYWFKCEPITWNVLNNNDGEYYILSTVLLDAHCYYNSTSYRTIDGNTVYPNNYEYSDIRTWLNNDFYNSAFALENSKIQATIVDNSAASTDSESNKFASNNTEDKVFLPSYQDYINPSYGFSTSPYSTDTRYCRTTDWARARGASYSISNPYNKYNGYYLTRSPYSNNSFNMWYVAESGYLKDYNTIETYYSVRPAITLKIA